MNYRHLIISLTNNADIFIDPTWQCPRIANGYLDYCVFDDGSAAPANTVYDAVMETDGFINVRIDQFVGSNDPNICMLQLMGWHLPGTPAPVRA